MVDNGYLSWSCTVPPDANGKTYKTIRFSEWLESMRKDVECTFGILKGRFAVLRYGIRFHKLYMCDQLFMTCCALHNLLLDVDGLPNNWEDGHQSDWYYESQITSLPALSINHTSSFAINRLRRDLSTSNNTSSDETNRKVLRAKCKKYTINGVREISKMPLHIFRQCLVNHFHIRFMKGNIKWPKRLTRPQY